jgi:Cation transporter/ATPase, N-terminus
VKARVRPGSGVKHRGGLASSLPPPLVHVTGGQRPRRVGIRAEPDGGNVRLVWLPPALAAGHLGRRWVGGTLSLALGRVSRPCDVDLDPLLARKEERRLSRMAGTERSMPAPIDLPTASHLPVAEVLERLGTSERGLSSDEAAARLRDFGANVLALHR